MSALTPEQAAIKMQQLQDTYSGDAEAVHSRMDDFMCSLLLDLGYKEVVAIFENTPMWYA